ncbi:hypothetical protein QJQ45_028547 [Haematococcus lacustris]|nr:hypothetical protein QJQ45_028547 [Haematococcus lacustris]
MIHSNPEGLSSLVSGGITPRTLIIDDGWQMTDVDPPSDQAPAVTPSDLAQRLTWLPEEERQLLADTQDEFIRESREASGGGGAVTCAAELAQHAKSKAHSEAIGMAQRAGGGAGSIKAAVKAATTTVVQGTYRRMVLAALFMVLWGHSAMSFAAHLQFATHSGALAMPHDFSATHYFNAALYSISQTLLTQQLAAVRGTPYFSLLADSSTDVGIEDHLLLYVRYLEPSSFIYHTSFLCAVKVVGATSEHITAVILRVIDTLSLDVGKLVAFCSDGASTFMGAHNGVIAKLQQQHVSIHRIIKHRLTNRLKLATVDSLMRIRLIGPSKHSYQKEEALIAHAASAMDEILKLKAAGKPEGILAALSEAALPLEVEQPNVPLDLEGIWKRQQRALTLALTLAMGLGPVLGGLVLAPDPLAALPPTLPPPPAVLPLQVLADTAARLSPGTSAGTSMPSLAGLGSAALPPPSASHPAAPSPAAHPSPAAGAALPSSPAGAAAGSGQQQGQGQGLEQSGAASQAAVAGAEVGGAAGGKAEALLFARLGQKVAGWLVGLGTAAFLIAYQWVVEPSAGGSAAVRGFAALAQGVLRPAMLGFYAVVARFASGSAVLVRSAGASDFTRRLISVRANAKFSSPDAGPDQPWAGVPEQLGKVVQAIKANWGVQYVYCWHGLPAYWAGVMPDAPEVAKFGAHILYAQPTPGVLEIEPSMAWNPAVLAGVGVLADPTAVYTEMHAYLRDAGVDGVKVDCQAGVGLVGSALGGGPALSRTFQAALERSISNYFPSNHAINCMCHSTENLYRMEATAVVRASDDFYPRDPASSHPHIAACAFNSVFLAALLQPDWDMFHSKHPAAYLHAMAR